MHPKPVLHRSATQARFSVHQIAANRRSVFMIHRDAKHCVASHTQNRGRPGDRIMGLGANDYGYSRTCNLSHSGLKRLSRCEQPDQISESSSRNQRSLEPGIAGALDAGSLDESAAPIVPRSCFVPPLRGGAPQLSLSEADALRRLSRAAHSQQSRRSAVLPSWPRHDPRVLR